MQVDRRFIICPLLLLLLLTEMLLMMILMLLLLSLSSWSDIPDQFTASMPLFVLHGSFPLLLVPYPSAVAASKKG